MMGSGGKPFVVVCLPFKPTLFVLSLYLSPGLDRNSDLNNCNSPVIFFELLDSFFSLSLPTLIPLPAPEAETVHCSQMGSCVTPVSSSHLLGSAIRSLNSVFTYAILRSR